MLINKNLIPMFIKSTEYAAYGAYKYKGKKDKIAADQAAVDGMRKQLNLIKMKGKIVIGEGEMDEAPMLYINENVGTNFGDELDIAVDPLEGTNFTANNLPNAFSVLAVTRKGNLLNAPDIYMEKIAIGPNLPDKLVDLDNTVKKNILLLSKAKGVKPNELTVCVLNRPRHVKIVDELKKMDVNINFISDGDVSGALSVSQPKMKIDLYIGTGGAPEGVLAAAALKCLGCQMQTRLVFQDNDEIKRSKNLGIEVLNKKYYIDDMVKGDVIFSATGVTDGDFVNGIKEKDDFFIAETLILHNSSDTNKIVRNKIRK